MPAYSDHRMRSAQRDDGVASGTAATAEKKQMKNSNLLEFGNANRTCLSAQMTGGWARGDGDMLCCCEYENNKRLAFEHKVQGMWWQRDF